MIYVSKEGILDELEISSLRRLPLRFHNAAYPRREMCWNELEFNGSPDGNSHCSPEFTRRKKGAKCHATIQRG